MQNQQITRPDPQSWSLAAVLVLVAVVLLSIGGLEVAVSEFQLQDAFGAAQVLRVGDDAAWGGARADRLLRRSCVGLREDRKVRQARNMRQTRNDGRQCPNFHCIDSTMTMAGGL